VSEYTYVLRVCVHLETSKVVLLVLSVLDRSIDLTLVLYCTVCDVMSCKDLMRRS
jgi:hypothetical protein